MIYKGNVWVMGDNIDTDVILPGKYLSMTDPAELGAKCFESLENGWSEKIRQGDILVVGKNFGCGSSREHAATAIKAAGISCVVGESFGTIFYRNAINLGLCALEIDNSQYISNEGHQIEIDLGTGEVKNHSNGTISTIRPPAPIILEILEAGGLMNYVAQRK